MWFTVQVTEEDIRHGKRLDCMECPVARAVNRAAPLRAGYAFQVDESYVAVQKSCDSGRGRWSWLWSAMNPDAVGKWICTFDASMGSVFTFRLDIPQQYVDLEALRVRTERAAEAAV